MALMLFFSPSLSCFIVPPSRKRDLSSAAASKENEAALALGCWDGWRGLCTPNSGLCSLILGSVGEKSINPCAASSGRAVPLPFPMLDFPGI